MLNDGRVLAFASLALLVGVSAIRGHGSPNTTSEADKPRLIRKILAIADRDGMSRADAEQLLAAQSVERLRAMLQTAEKEQERERLLDEVVRTGQFGRRSATQVRFELRGYTAPQLRGMLQTARRRAQAVRA